MKLKTAINTKEPSGVIDKIMHYKIIARRNDFVMKIGFIYGLVLILFLSFSYHT